MSRRTILSPLHVPMTWGWQTRNRSRWWDGMVLGALLGRSAPVDVSPYRRTLTVDNSSGAITRVPAPMLGGAMNFYTDNVNDRIDLGSIPSTDPLSFSGTQQLTIVAHIYIPSTWHQLNTYPRIIDKSDGGSGANGWFIYSEAGASYDTIQFCCGASTGHGAKFPPYQGMWSTWCWRVDDTTGGDSTRIWINGEERTVTEHATITLPAPTTTTNAAIGNWNHTTDRIFEGDIASVWAWDRLLSPQECRDITLDPYAPLRESAILPTASGLPAGVYRDITMRIV